MSQSKYANDECNPHITLYDNFDPLYGNFVNCIHSRVYYYVVRPYNMNTPISQILPNLNSLNVSRPMSTNGYLPALVDAQANASYSTGNTV